MKVWHSIVAGPLRWLRLRFLCKRLQRGPISRRCAAAKALGELDDSRAVDPLIEALRQSEEEVKLAAVGALGQLRYLRAAKPLIGMLYDRAASVNDAAV